MIKSVKLTLKQYNKLWAQIKNDYPISVTLIRDKTKRVLGFVSRNHVTCDPTDDHFMYVYLDFYDAHKKTMFMLKYSEFLNDNSKHNRK